MHARGSSAAAGVPPSAGAVSWPDWLEHRMSLLGFRSGSALARASRVPDSVISRWRSGATTPSLAQLRRLQGPLQAPLVELLVAARLITLAEADLQMPSAPAPAMRDVRDAVQRDPVLTDDLKHLLITQYDAMCALARARDGAAPAASQ